MMVRHLLLMPALVCAAAITSSSGCGKATPAVFPVTGIVTYQDQPVEGAQVMFTPTNGRAAEGTTDAQGKFSLTTFSAGDGALEGQHRVTIVKMVKQDAGDPYSVTKNVLPARYADPAQSPLVEEIANPGRKEISFILTDR